MVKRLLDVQAFRTDLLRQRKEIDMQLDLLDSMEEKGSRYFVDPDQSPAAAAVLAAPAKATDAAGKNFNAVWQGSTPDMTAIQSIVSGAYPGFAVLNEKSLAQHSIKETQISGILSALTKLCKAVGLQRSDLFTTRRKKIDGVSKVIYRLTDDAYASFAAHAEQAAIPVHSETSEPGEPARPATIRERLMAIWPNDGTPRTAEDAWKLYREKHPEEKKVGIHTIRGRISDLKSEGFLVKVGDSVPQEVIRRA